MKKKVLILKNDRTGDLFVSLRAINRIISKHTSDDISIYLSKVNHKFSFIFPQIKKKIISMDLGILDKINVFLYVLFNKIDTIYILSPKNFYFYLPLFFRKIKFYAITIKSLKDRPPPFLLKYLFKFEVLDRMIIKKRKSSYLVQESLVEYTSNHNYLNKTTITSHNLKYPNKFIFFHYKKKLFNELLNWDLNTVNELIYFLSNKFENICFSSELNDNEINSFFVSKFNHYNFDDNKIININDKNILFLKNIDGSNLFDAVKKSTKIISPEGIITHMGHFLEKPTLALMYFHLKNRRDFINQVISCKEWFPPNNYDYSVLKNDFNRSIEKITKRI